SSSKSGLPASTTTPSSAPPASGTATATPTTTAAAATSTTAAPVTSTACIFGNWAIISPQSFSGSSWAIHSDGTANVIYKGLLSGPATFDTTLPSNPHGSSGSYVATPVSQHVTSNGQPVALTAHNTTWTCQGNSLTLVVSSSGTF